MLVVVGANRRLTASLCVKNENNTFLQFDQLFNRIILHVLKGKVQLKFIELQIS